FFELEGLHQADAAHVLGANVPKGRSKKVAHLGGVADQPIAFDHVQHGRGRGASERIPTKGRAVVARLEDVRARTGQTGPDGKAAAQALRQGHDVGRDARVLVREPPAGATQPGLNLVEDEQQVFPVAPYADALEVAGSGGSDADLA